MENTDIYDFAQHVGRRWPTVVLTSAIAVGLAVAVSLMATKQYTAVCKIIIEPPAVSDPRAAQALTPIYLESLKSYQHFATSDSLFEKALDCFRLRESRKMPIEDWKRRILKVEIPANTKIMEVRASLPDPKQAQAFALYLAQETVKLNRNLNLEGDQELAREAETQFAEAQARLNKAETASRRAAIQEPTERIAEEIRSAEALRDTVGRDLLAAEMMVADDVEREKYLAAAGRSSELENVRSELRFTRSRVEDLRKHGEELANEIAQRQKVFAARMSLRENLQAELKDAQANLEATESRLRDVRVALGYRGERLNIIDPGIPPERPSSPNIPLNVLGALLFGLIASVLYLTVTFGFGRRKAVLAPASQRHVA